MFTALISEVCFLFKGSRSRYFFSKDTGLAEPSCISVKNDLNFPIDTIQVFFNSSISCVKTVLIPLSTRYFMTFTSLLLSTVKIKKSSRSTSNSRSFWVSQSGCCSGRFALCWSMFVCVLSTSAVFSEMVFEAAVISCHFLNCLPQFLHFVHLQYSDLVHFLLNAVYVESFDRFFYILLVCLCAFFVV